MAISNPFNRGIPDPTEIVGRYEQIKVFRSYLDATINRKPISMSVIGIRGIGKTTLLRKYENIVESSNGIAIRIDMLEGDDLESMCKKILYELSVKIREKSMLKILSSKIGRFLKSYSIEIKYNEFGLKIETVRDKEQILSTVLKEKLIEVWKNVGNEVSSIVFLIDESEYLENITGALMFLRNVFSRLAEFNCGYTIVLSGKLTFHKKMSELFSPLTRYFHPLELGPLTESEVKELIDSELAKTSIEMSDKCLKLILQESQGHPYVVVTMCWVLYDRLPQSENVITELHFKACSESIMGMLSRELFRGMYEKTPEYERNVLNQIAKFGGYLTTSKISEMLGVRSTTIGPALARLVDRGCLIKPSRGKYQIFHPLFARYIMNKLDDSTSNG
jgi:type II secretory pathway predicted ATPase ExeA